MRTFASILLVLAVALASCKTPSEKEKVKQAALKKKAKANLREENNDVDFQAFVGRLRKAVANHDINTLKSMMTDDFGYKLEPAMSGQGVFQYWDERSEEHTSELQSL